MTITKITSLVKKQCLSTGNRSVPSTAIIRIGSDIWVAVTNAAAIVENTEERRESSSVTNNRTRSRKMPEWMNDYET